MSAHIKTSSRQMLAQNGQKINIGSVREMVEINAITCLPLLLDFLFSVEIH